MLSPTTYFNMSADPNGKRRMCALPGAETRGMFPDWNLAHAVCMGWDMGNCNNSSCVLEQGKEPYFPEDGKSDKATLYLVVDEENDCLEISFDKPSEESGMEHTWMSGIKHLIGRTDIRTVHQGHVAMWAANKLSLVPTPAGDALDISFMGKSISVEKIATAVLRRLIDHLSDMYGGCAWVFCATVPAGFQTDVCAAYRKILTTVLPAGTELRITSEPFAAALSTMQDLGLDSGTHQLLLFDMGSGTTNFAYNEIKLGDGAPSSKLLAARTSDAYCGNMQTLDIQNRINADIMEDYCKVNPEPPRPAGPGTGTRKAAKAAAEAVSLAPGIRQQTHADWSKTLDLYQLDFDEAQKIKHHLQPDSVTSYAQAMTANKKRQLKLLRSDIKFTLPVSLTELFEKRSTAKLVKEIKAWLDALDDIFKKKGRVMQLVVVCVGGGVRGAGVLSTIQDMVKDRYQGAVEFRFANDVLRHVSKGAALYAQACRSSMTTMVVDDNLTTACFGFLYKKRERSDDNKFVVVVRVVIEGNKPTPAKGEAGVGEGDGLCTDELELIDGVWMMKLDVVEGALLQDNQPAHKLRSNVNRYVVMVKVPSSQADQKCVVRMTATVDRKLVVTVDVEGEETEETISGAGGSGAGGSGAGGSGSGAGDVVDVVDTAE